VDRPDALTRRAAVTGDGLRAATKTTKITKTTKKTYRLFVILVAFVIL
jgi:hypothetical protein